MCRGLFYIPNVESDMWAEKREMALAPDFL